MSRGRHLHPVVSIFTVLFCFTILNVASIQAAQVYLAWDAPEPDAEDSSLTNPAGYKLYYGPAGRSYEFVLDVGQVTSTIVDGLEEGQPYYITVTAYDIMGVESDFSNEVIALAGSAPLKPEGLVAAYGFDEGSGATVADASGNDHAGVISGASWTGSGRFGNALLFDGIDDWVTIEDSPSLYFSSSMTLSAWVYPSTMQSGRRAVVHKALDAYYLHASYDEGALRPAGGGTFDDLGSYVTVPAAIPVNAWSYLAFTYDGETLRLYVNGEESSSMPQMGELETVTTPLQIGGNTPYGEYFEGQVDEVRIYNRALSPGEIQADMEIPVN